MSAIRILIIEDSLPDIQILRFALDRLGEPYMLEILSNGEAALQFVHENRAGTKKPEPCVILLDLHLPKYDGIVILQAIKQAPALSHIQVVVLTGSGSPTQRAEIEQLGALFRQKPMALSEFEAFGREILEICKGLMVSLG